MPGPVEDLHRAIRTARDRTTGRDEYVATATGLPRPSLNEDVAAGAAKVVRVDPDIDVAACAVRSEARLDYDATGIPAAGVIARLDRDGPSVVAVARARGDADLAADVGRVPDMRADEELSADADRLDRAATVLSRCQS
jgi:hypothetical protein